MRQCGRFRNGEILFVGSRDNNEAYIFSDNGIGNETVATASAVAVATTPRTGYVRSVGKERVRKNYGSWTSAQRCSARVKSRAPISQVGRVRVVRGSRSSRISSSSQQMGKREAISQFLAFQDCYSLWKGAGSPRRRNNTFSVRKEKKSALGTGVGDIRYSRLARLRMRIRSSEVNSRRKLIQLRYAVMLIELLTNVEGTVVYQFRVSDQ